MVGISASGRTPFVLGAIAYARSVGALTVGFVLQPLRARSPSAAELPIELLVGSEVIAGSTRLNAGTAQKITLNILSTAVMVQLGKTYGNLMVDVRPTNEKLRDRAVRIVAAVTKTGPERAGEALEAAGGGPSPPASWPSTAMDAAEAAGLLEAAGGRLRAALEAVRHGASERAPAAGRGRPSPPRAPARRRAPSCSTGPPRARRRRCRRRQGRRARSAPDGAASPSPASSTCR